MTDRIEQAVTPETTNSTFAFELRDVTKSYDSFKLGPISFALPSGYVMGFIGPNGAGKTTTLKAMINVIHHGGQVMIGGVDNQIASMEEIGVVMDTPIYVGEWTINQLRGILKPFYAHWDDTVFTARLRGFGLDLDKRVKDLSRGMGVKLQIAVALSHHAKLLILDEPTSGLDPIAREEVGDLLRQFVGDERHSVLFSTHITSDLERVADYITFILAGRIAFSGATSDLLEKYVRVAGDPSALTSDQKRLIVGYSSHPAGFDGLVEAGNRNLLPAAVLAEKPSLDDIVIYLNKGAHHE
ncbi:MAG: ABC transporter ATP-binding protein [Propionibacteriaceae bacterium]|jgi:ABC-2 type transport system ATP-binding protein|nr:ABC transporter ATP-binding protein [Propionibacteriaceae bacterium]